MVASTEFVVLLGGLFVIACLVGGGVFNLRRIDMQAMKAADSMTALGIRAWSYLTPAQQDELKGINSLLIQEEWLEEHLDASLLEGVSAERVLIEFANRGFISLGQGVFRRHASPLDFIEPAASIADTEKTEEEESKLEAEPIEEGALFDEIRKLHPSDALLKDMEAVEGESTEMAPLDENPSEEKGDTDGADEVKPVTQKNAEEHLVQLIIPEGDCRECESVSSARGKYDVSDGVTSKDKKEPNDTTE